MIQIEYEGIYNTAIIIVSIAVGWIGKHYIEIYANSKKRIQIIRKLIDEVDDALKDDTISEEEFRMIFQHAKELIQK